ncbi:cation:proton antiporter [Campylobacter sp. RM16187]|uniref:cation:proton antiporter n=1 Tax=Campylobacter sp. RM16187 TaxID=1660063 RepID=UPI0021B4EFF6|nr:cation:proton antiporter [Campylobacter sp. RM16187]QKG30154.1 Na+/H+ exchanger family protein [Campylobacter sp. RM16187]
MQTDGASGLSILIVLAFIIFTSPYFSKILRIPIAPIEIILGSIAGYLGLIGHNDIFHIVSEVGFFYLMFLAGTEVDLKLFFTIDKKILKAGIVYILILYLLSALLTFGFDLNRLFILIIPIMAVGMIFTLFKEYGREEEWLNIGMLIASIGEVISIILLTFVGAYMKFGTGSELLFSIIYLVGFLIFSMIGFKILNVLFWWYPQLKVILMPYYDNSERDIRLCMALFFSIIALMLYLNLEIAFGAFVAGTFIASFFDHKKDLPHKLASFGFGFLVPTFFVYIGSTFKLSAFMIDGVVKDAALIVGVMIGFRIISSFVFLNILGFKKMILYALSHSMPLTLLIAVATIAHKSGDISEEFYFSCILASLTQAIIVTIGIKIIMGYKNKSLKT